MACVCGGVDAIHDGAGVLKLAVRAVQDAQLAVSTRSIVGGIKDEDGVPPGQRGQGDSIACLVEAMEIGRRSTHWNRRAEHRT